MPLLTLNQAAKESKRSKSTLLNAIRSGRLSAVKDDTGYYQIDPAELFRVYPSTPIIEHGIPPETTHRTELLEQKIGFLEATIASMERERDDLRQDRDHWRQQATRLLTPSSEVQPEARRPFFARARFWMGLVAVLALALAVIALFWQVVGGR